MNYRLDLDRIYRDFKTVNPKFKKTVDYEKITGVNQLTVSSWALKSPPIVELIYWNSKVFNLEFMELIKEKSELFPVLKLLRYYEQTTGYKIESVILKD